ncbi:hypothetical protein Pcinc_009652 [Petrolisthes cinctipes]|uniref:Uncharacterized protein n=1 Tax=Petrolisthes cinctipes TaxID=88211 RepID=A0AAE1KW58_PETCI|nr:hypothetical protein Pcinc_009652 [Petrolisthes cinctipes]
MLKCSSTALPPYGRELLSFTCLYHIFKLMVYALFSANLESSSANEIQFIKCFQALWEDINLQTTWKRSMMTDAPIAAGTPQQDLNLLTAFISYNVEQSEGKATPGNFSNPTGRFSEEMMGLSLFDL